MPPGARRYQLASAASCHLSLRERGQVTSTDGQCFHGKYWVATAGHGLTKQCPARLTGHTGDICVCCCSQEDVEAAGSRAAGGRVGVGVVDWVAASHLRTMPACQSPVAAKTDKCEHCLGSTASPMLLVKMSRTVVDLSTLNASCVGWQESCGAPNVVGYSPCAAQRAVVSPLLSSCDHARYMRQRHGSSK